jgi:hypothetical protein
VDSPAMTFIPIASNSDKAIALSFNLFIPVYYFTFYIYIVVISVVNPMSCRFFKPSLERYGYKRTIPLAAPFFGRNEGNGKLLSMNRILCGEELC